MSAATLPAPGAQAPILPPGKLDLKYLFCAQFADGTVCVQTSEDLHPTVEGRNAFYELLHVDPEGNPSQDGEGKIFCRSDILLFQLEDGSHRYLVDLRDGHFEIQHPAKKGHFVGAHFYLAFPPAGAKLRPFYFRRRRHHTNVSGTVQEDLTVKVDEMKEISQECEYHFGCETEDRKHRAEMILV